MTNCQSKDYEIMFEKKKKKLGLVYSSVAMCWSSINGDFWFNLNTFIL